MNGPKDERRLADFPIIPGQIVELPAGYQFDRRPYEQMLRESSDDLIILYECPWCGTAHFRYSEEWENENLIDPNEHEIKCRCGRAISELPRRDTSERQILIERRLGG